MGLVHCCENAQFLRYRSEHTCASVTYYEVDLVTKALHYEAKYAMNLKQDTTHLDTGDLIPTVKPTKTMDIGMCTGK